ncbi:MltR family transcriptional regulator [Hydrogenophaga borbori]|uniref:MltR family transcriptional regulator n=1 Tax=Hydrogenophaga borbori TaxID=2294117 RepID=UPI001C6DDE5D|nr:MltR family transcriptional regulator [Hydrogenophaga borbori]
MRDSSGPDPIEGEDQAFGGFNLLTKSLRDLDDRGLVLSLSAFAEDALGSLLKAFMHPCEATTQLLEGFNAPLGTLSSRIKAAYSLGLTTKEQFSDLERLRKIRNEFAHEWRPLSLSQPKLAALVAAMNYSGIDNHFPKTPAEKVRSSITCLLLELRSAAEQIPKRGGQVRVSGNHLIAGFSGANFQEQVENARKELARIEEQLACTADEEQVFYRGLLKRFPGRVALIHPKTAEERASLVAIQEEVRNASRQSPV